VYDRTIGREDFFGFPQVPTAATVAELTHLAEEAGAQLIIRALEEPGLARVAGRLASEIEMMPGPEKTAEALEQLVDVRATVAGHRDLRLGARDAAR
jgi:hypothetical protein